MVPAEETRPIVANSRGQTPPIGHENPAYQSQVTGQLSPLPEPMTQPFLLALQQGLERCGYSGGPLIVGVSGGPDSMALLHALRRAGDAEFAVLPIAVHVDHGLRPESAEEANQVREWCRELGVPVHVFRAEISASARAGVEESARRARYEILTQQAAELNCRYVAVAHHADDHVETVLHHILRGTGLQGLRGIPEVRGLRGDVRLIRPLLRISRDEIHRFLDEHAIATLQDASNDDVAFTRNRIRHELLPLLEHDYNSQIRLALARLSVQAAELQELVDAQAEPLLRHVTTADGTTSVRCDQLVGAPRPIVRALLVRIWTDAGWPRQKMGFDDWNALADLVASGPGSRDLPGGVRAERRKATLRLFRRDTA